MIPLIVNIKKVLWSIAVWLIHIAMTIMIRSRTLVDNVRGLLIALAEGMRGILQRWPIQVWMIRLIMGLSTSEIEHFLPIVEGMIIVMQNGEESEETVWDPVDFFCNARNVDYAVLILNQPIILRQHIIMPIWKKAQIKITVDGGTNRWLEYLNSIGITDEILKKNHQEYTPTMMVGDFDSIDPEKLNKLEKLGASVIKTPDQNYTDFSKALMQLATTCKSKNISLDAVYVFVENGGRFDHQMGNINTLYQTKKLMGDGHVEKIVMISSNSLTWLLRSGKHRIKIPDALRHNNSAIGLIPFGSTVRNITTTGLKYNLHNDQMAFGKLVSTSNTSNGSSEVTVSTDTQFIWTMDIESLLENTKS